MIGFLNVFQVAIWGGAGLCIVFLILTIVIMIKFNIPKIIGNITGITEKKEIKKMKDRKEHDSMERLYRAESIDLQRGESKQPGSITQKIPVQGEENYLVLGAVSTERLGCETQVLMNEPIQISWEEQNKNQADETQLLLEKPMFNLEGPELQFKLETEVTYIHTEKEIDLNGEENE